MWSSNSTPRSVNVLFFCFDHRSNRKLYSSETWAILSAAGCRQTYSEGTLPGRLHCSTETLRQTSLNRSFDNAALLVNVIFHFHFHGPGIQISNTTHLHDEIHTSSHFLLIKPDKCLLLLFSKSTVTGINLCLESDWKCEKHKSHLFNVEEDGELLIYQ